MSPSGSNRRRFLARTAVLALAQPFFVRAALSARSPKDPESAAEPKSPARETRRLSIAEAFDGEMEQFMSERKIPGGALAVARNGKLVYAQGYGWADVKAKEPVRPASLFRIASISKPFTAAGILKLSETGRLDLDAPVFDLLKLEPLPGKERDSRLKDITVRHCLHHTGGWDRQVSGDPMFRSREIAEAAGVPVPARQESIIRYMLGQRLDFDPGFRYAYSNFGYCVLGRVIEKVTQRKYADFVREEVLAPLGIKRMRLGATLEKGRATGEVTYYTPRNGTGKCLFEEQAGDVPLPYGTFCLEAMDSHGGWIASAIDLVRFAVSLDLSARGCLKPATCQTFFEPPAPPVSRTEKGGLEAVFYGCGWLVRRIRPNGAINSWHNGSLPGTFTLLVRRHDGLAWAALFNQRSEGRRLRDDPIDGALHRAANAVKDWPKEDLFTSYG